MLIVGEKINISRKNIAQAVETKDAATIQSVAWAQVDGGADYIDINAIKPVRAVKMKHFFKRRDP